MVEVTLKFKGDVTDFEKVLTASAAFEDMFSITDSIIWELDYGEGKSTHSTIYGDIEITAKTEDDEDEN